MIRRSPSLYAWLEEYGDEFDAVCLDIDGVLLKSGCRLPGSRRLLDYLRQNGIAFVLLTNDGNHATREKAERLSLAGLDIAPDQIISCGHAIAPQIQSLGMVGKTFFVMGDTGDPCYVRAAGLEVTRDTGKLKECQGVIIGEEHYEWEPVINAIVNYFIDSPLAPLIVPNPDEFYPASKLKIHIASGGIARFMQHVLKAYGVDITPIYLGKPYPPIFRMAHSDLERQLGRALDPDKMLMVGDNLAADIAGAQSMGYKSALVLTGVSSADAVSHSNFLPDMVFETI